MPAANVEGAKQVYNERLSKLEEETRSMVSMQQGTPTPGFRRHRSKLNAAEPVLSIASEALDGVFAHLDMESPSSPSPPSSRNSSPLKDDSGGESRESKVKNVFRI